MDCRVAEELLPAYVLNALSGDEEAQVEAHLDRCPWCPTLLREHLRVAGALAQAAESLQPPDALKTRMLRAVDEQMRPRPAAVRRPFRVARLALGAAATAAVLMLGAVIGVTVYTSDQIDDLRGDNVRMSGQIDDLRGDNVRMSGQIDDLQGENLQVAFQVAEHAQIDETLVDMLTDQRSMSYVLASSDRQVLSLEAAEMEPRPQGVFLVASQSGTAMLITKDLEPLSSDEIYNVWLTIEGRSFAAGKLSIDELGWGVITVWPDQPITSTSWVWVTAEPAQGSSEPTGEPVLWGSMAESTSR